VCLPFSVHMVIDPRFFWSWRVKRQYLMPRPSSPGVTSPGGRLMLLCSRPQSSTKGRST
ncbi:hypothetical protein LDENG_00208670, partial [Lucifuga dentata]